MRCFRFFISFILFFISLNIKRKSLAQDTCTVDNVINGNLGLNLNKLDTISSTYPSNSISITDAMSGSIDINCTNAATALGISSVVQTNNLGITLADFTTVISGLSSEIISNNGAASTTAQIGTIGTRTIEIDIDATYKSILQPGNYNFIVNLELLP